MNLIIAILLSVSGMIMYFIDDYILTKLKNSKVYFNKIISLLIALNGFWIIYNFKINNIEAMKFVVAGELFSWKKYFDWKE